MDMLHFGVFPPVVGNTGYRLVRVAAPVKARASYSVKHPAASQRQLRDRGYSEHLTLFGEHTRPRVYLDAPSRPLLRNDVNQNASQ